MTEKQFFKIIDDYYIEYDGEIFDLHKPSDIRSFVYLLNRMQGFDELECEYNDEQLKQCEEIIITFDKTGEILKTELMKND